MQHAAGRLHNSVWKAVRDRAIESKGSGFRKTLTLKQALPADRSASRSPSLLLLSRFR
jgi:hypothetical protein